MNKKTDLEKVTELLIHFDVNLMMSMIVKKLLKKDDEKYSPFFNAVAMTLGWAVGGVISEKLGIKGGSECDRCDCDE